MLYEPPANALRLPCFVYVAVDRGGAAAAAAGGAQPPKASDLEVRDITDLVCK